MPDSNRTPSRIVICSPRIPPRYSGAGLRSWGMAKDLVSRGFDVLVLTYTDSTAPPDPIPVKTVRMWKLKGISTIPAFRRILAPLVYLVTVCELVLTFGTRRPEIVHVVGCSFGAQLFAFAALIAGRKVICEPTLLGDDDALTLRQLPFGAFRIWILKRMSMVVCLSPALAIGMEKVGVATEKISVIGNGVDTERFAPVESQEKARIRTQLRLPAEAFVFVTTGPLVPRKGMVELIDQFSRIAADNPSLYLIMVGPTEYPEFQAYQDGLEEVWLRFGTRDRVIFSGEQEDVVPWLQAADAFVFASRAEGFGTAVVEAMACGLPVILRDIPGISEYILGPVPEQRIVETDSGLGLVMSRMARKGVSGRERFNMRTRAVSNFSTGAIIAKYIEIYELLCGACLTRSRISDS